MEIHCEPGLYREDFIGDFRGVLGIERVMDTFFFKCRKIMVLSLQRASH